MTVSYHLLKLVADGMNSIESLRAALSTDRRTVMNALGRLRRKALVEPFASTENHKFVQAYRITEAGHGHLNKLHAARTSPVSRYVPVERRSAGLRKRAWWHIRRHHGATMKTLLSTYTDGTEKAAYATLYYYLSALEKCGILVRVCGAVRSQRLNTEWRLAQDVGPLAPVVRSATRSVFDPNSGSSLALDGGDSNDAGDGDA